MLNKLFSSPKTTTGGILMMLAAVAQLVCQKLHVDPDTAAGLVTAILAIGGLTMGVSARDNGKSSEDVGAGK